MPRMNELWMPMIGKPDPGHAEHRDHGDDLRDQPALQRLADAVDDHGGAGAMSGRRHEQQSVAVDARLGRKGQPQKQHDEEVADRADGAEQQFQGLADDGAAAGGERAGAGQVCGVGARRRAGAASSEAGADRLPKSKKLVSMPFCSRKALTLTSCDLMVLLSTVACWAMVAPPRKTMPDSMPASARQTIASRSGCGSLHQAAEQVGHGVEGDAEQHAGKDQEQGRGEIPGEQRAARRTARRRCRRPISPTPDRCGPEGDRQPDLSR